MRRVRWKIKFVSKTFMYLLEGSLLYKLQTSIRGEGGCISSPSPSSATAFSVAVFLGETE